MNHRDPDDLDPMFGLWSNIVIPAILIGGLVLVFIRAISPTI